jgi:hypothetical protein
MTDFTNKMNKIVVSNVENCNIISISIYIQEKNKTKNKYHHILQTFK